MTNRSNSNPSMEPSPQVDLKFSIKWKTNSELQTKQMRSPRPKGKVARMIKSPSRSAITNKNHYIAPRFQISHYASPKRIAGPPYRNPRRNPT